jgi:hypothetical protein
MQALTREAILAASDLKPTKVDVPEWGGFVHIRQMTGAERGALEAESMGDKKTHVATLRARMAARCICDETGNRLFSDADIEALGKKSQAALDRVLAAITQANGLGDEGVTAAGESSTGGQSAGSGPSSP